MVSTCITLQYRTPLIVTGDSLTARRYFIEMLEPHSVAFVCQLPNVKLFLHDK